MRIQEVLQAQQVVSALMQGIEAQRWLDLHELYAEDAVVEYPFAPPHRRRIEGREAIRKHFAAAAAASIERRLVNLIIHRTAEPEVVVAEWDWDGIVATTGRTFRVSNIQVTRVVRSKIATSRDYHDHTMMAIAMGRLPELIAGLPAS